jgi:predicted thioesterase
MLTRLGKSAQSEIVVDSSNTAIAIGSGSLPVFATPSLIALIENAAVKCINDCFDEASTTVGIVLNVEHTRASPIGEKIIAISTLVNINGRELSFEVEAYDSKGIVGKGRHKRFVVDVEKFMNKLK